MLTAQVAAQERVRQRQSACSSGRLLSPCVLHRCKLYGADYLSFCLTIAPTSLRLCQAPVETKR